MCIFKLISFLKVNQHAQHSNGSFWFVLLFNVNLQTYFVFESKLTFTTFKWLFKVCALLQCVSSNIFPFWKSKIKIKIKTMSFWSDICTITWEAPGHLQTYFLFESKLTCTTFKWLFKMCALFKCESCNLALSLNFIDVCFLNKHIGERLQVSWDFGSILSSLFCVLCYIIFFTILTLPNYALCSLWTAPDDSRSCR